MPRRGILRRGPLALLALAPIVSCGIVASPAAAKTFTARITDPAGDAPAGTPDITAARVAYNRRTGAMSFSVTMADTIDVKKSPAIVMVGIDGLRHGRCTSDLQISAYMLAFPDIAAAPTSPDDISGLIGAAAFRNNEGQAFAAARGRQTIKDATISMRTRHSRKLGGLHPGCAYVAIVTSFDSDDGIKDETVGNTGFSTS